jgi:hypothetical protein
MPRDCYPEMVAAAEDIIKLLGERFPDSPRLASGAAAIVLGRLCAVQEISLAKALIISKIISEISPEELNRL